MIRVFRAAVPAEAVHVIMIFVEGAGLRHVIAAAVAVVHDFLAGSFLDRRRTITHPSMRRVTNPANVIFPIRARLVYVLMVPAIDFLFADRAFLVVSPRWSNPHIVRGVALRFDFFFLFHAADAASDRSDARLGAGGGVGAFHFFPEMLLRRAALRADVVVLRVPGVVCPVVGERVADDRLTILAEQNMGSVLQIFVGRMLMGAVLDQTTAVAHVVNGAVRILHSFHHMVDIKIAIDRFDAVAHNIAVIVAAAAEAVR